MPHTSGRRRAPAHYRGKPRRHPAAAQRPQRPAVRRRRLTTRSELDRALAARALDCCRSRPLASFAELGLDAGLVAALAARGHPRAVRHPGARPARRHGGRDVLGRAETGSGKTLAFGLPMLSRIAWMQRPGPRAKAPRGLILVPTRELAQQVAGVLTPLGRSIGVSVTTVYGGVPIGRQITRLAGGVDIVVATPGRLIDLIERGPAGWPTSSITVLDEADHMADLGFLPSVTRILDETPAGGQRLLFSATLDRGVDRLVRSYLTDPALHAVTPEVIAGGAAEHSMLVLDAEDKLAVAAEMASRPARTLFFVRTKHGADRLAKQLERAGVPAAAIHGDRNQNQRQRALDAFAAGHPRVLVATDVAARGIHVDGIELVVHFDPPNDHKDYLHRSGRTAQGRRDRAGRRRWPRASRSARSSACIEAAGVQPARHHVDGGASGRARDRDDGHAGAAAAARAERRPRPAGAPPRPAAALAGRPRLGVPARARRAPASRAGR